MPRDELGGALSLPARGGRRVQDLEVVHGVALGRRGLVGEA